jgi:hypothetical protein
MNKRILISEDEKKKIISLHENQKKSVNYFEILEKTYKNLISEQHTDPVIYPGEFLTPDGKIVKKTQGVKPTLTMKINTNFPPGKDAPFTLTDEEIEKIKNWYSDYKLTNVETEIIVTAGSSKSGKGSEEERKIFNIDLAKRRANTAFEVIKGLLTTFVKPEILEKIKYITDVSQAFAGPEFVPGTNNSKEPQYQPFQFVTVTIQAKGTKTVESSRDIKFQPYMLQPYNGFTNVSIVKFCVKGFSVPEYGGYQCDGGNGGFRQVYYANNNKKDVSEQRWLPIDSSDIGYQDLENSNFRNSEGIFAGKAGWCFQYEKMGGEKYPECQELYAKWPNYNYRYRKGGVGSDWSLPGPEVNENIYSMIQKNWKVFLDRLKGGNTTSTTR